MEFLKTQQPKDIDNDWLNILQEDFIQPLQKRGAEFLGYGHQYSNNLEANIHTLVFETETDIPTGFLNNLMIQDDSQPKPSYTYYFGTIWIFLPYIS